MEMKNGKQLVGKGDTFMFGKDTLRIVDMVDGDNGTVVLKVEKTGKMMEYGRKTLQRILWRSGYDLKEA